MEEFKLKYFEKYKNINDIEFYVLKDEFCHYDGVERKKVLNENVLQNDKDVELFLNEASNCRYMRAFLRTCYNYLAKRVENRPAIILKENIDTEAQIRDIDTVFRITRYVVLKHKLDNDNTSLIIMDLRPSIVVEIIRYANIQLDTEFVDALLYIIQCNSHKYITLDYLINVIKRRCENESDKLKIELLYGGI